MYWTEVRQEKSNMNETLKYIKGVKRIKESCIFNIVQEHI